MLTADGVHTTGDHLRGWVNFGGWEGFRVSKEWLTVGEAARLLGVSEQSVRDYGAKGQLTVGRTPGGHRRISHESAERLRVQMYPPEPTAGQADTLQADSPPAT